MKLLEENLGGMLQDKGMGNDFFNRTLIAQEIIAKIEK
jgi:hypothetical protein